MEAGEKILRTFVCVVPPAETMEEMERLLAALRPLAAREFKWVGREQLHLTLRFLGEAPEARAAAMDGALRAVPMPAAFEIEIAGAGGFPNLNRPRALWLGVKRGADELADLAAIAESAALSAGYGRADKKAKNFRAHLTLARARGEGAAIPEGLRDRLADEGTLPAFSWRCENLVLMRSELTPAGPIYTRLGTYELTNAKIEDRRVVHVGKNSQTR